EDESCSASVHDYLDICFPEAQPDKLEHPQSAVPRLSDQTQYLSTWTLSQALLLRGRGSIHSATSPEKAPPPQTSPKDAKTPPSVSSGTPELFSPVTPSLGASAELFSQPCPTPRVEEGGVVIEAITDGVLCSQEATTAQPSPSKAPDFKKARISDNIATEASVLLSNSTSTTDTNTTGLRSPTTLLARCDRRGAQYSVLVAVVHPCHLKEVKVKSGLAAGTFVPLASIVVTDQSAMEMKVVLWRRAAFWALTVCPGEILLITGLRLNDNRWKGETVLQSTFSSKLLNLGQISASSSPPGTKLHLWPIRNLSCFHSTRRPLLVSLNVRPPQDLNRLPYATLRSLRVNTLVHALLRVKHTHLSTGEFVYIFRHLSIVTVEQPESQQGALVLWGAAVDWLPRFTKNTVWDFHILLVRECLTAELPELHSTPWSSVQPLDPASRRAKDFLKLQTIQTRSSSTLELDLDTLLSQKYSGEVELRVQVTAFHFKESLSSHNSTHIVEVLCGDITYTGCGRCSAELDTDANGIYVQCYPCLPHTTVRRYYRSGVLTVSGQGSSQVCVQVPPVPLQKILEAPPDKLQRSSERIRTVLSLPRKTFILTIRSHFLCDENSVPLRQDFTLLDLQLSDHI
uniref:Uncharacterized protein n=1 Tax=Mola mola TaxID=94237 RepID=A0A3Q3WDA5_MOLML